MNKEKGVTLAALALTIIVMLILAGTTAYVLNGNNSALKSAQNIQNGYEAETTKANETEAELNSKWKNVINKKGVDKELNVK